MPRVSINQHAFYNPRLKIAGRQLRMSPAALGWQLAFAWSQVTEQGHPYLDVAVVAECIGKKPDAVREALARVELAVVSQGDVLDLSPMASLFGDYEWLTELRETSADGGAVRASTAKRHADGRFASDDIQGKVLALLQGGPRRRAELRHALHMRKAAVLGAVRELLDAGAIVDTDGLLSVVPVPGTGREPVGPEPGTDREPMTAEPGTDRELTTPEPGTTREPPEPGTTDPVPSALALAPALALARESGARALVGARADTPAREREPAVLATTAKVEPGRRRQVAEALWAYQRELRAQLDGEAPDLPFDTIPGGTADAVVLALARYSPAQCRHALEVFAAEGACMRDDGRDPLQYLNGRTNWKPEQLDRAVGSTVQAMRKRHKSAKRPEPVGNPATRNRLA